MTKRPIRAGQKSIPAIRTPVSHKKFSQTFPPALPCFLQEVKKWANFTPIFDPTRSLSAVVSKRRNSEKRTECADGRAKESPSSPISPAGLPEIKID